MSNTVNDMDAADDFDVSAASDRAQVSASAPTVAAVSNPPSPAAPATLADAYKLLQAAENLPTRTPAEERAKQDAIRFARFHTGRLQQTPELTPEQANDMAAQMVHMASRVTAMKLESLAREDADIAALLKENADLKAQLKSITDGQ